jgi:hypothetical protein
MSIEIRKRVARALDEDVTDEELAHYREAVAGATDGPWAWVEIYEEKAIFYEVRDVDENEVAGTHMTLGDARFIANARVALPRLLDEVERLRKLRDGSKSGLAPELDLEVGARVKWADGSFGSIPSFRNMRGAIAQVMEHDSTVYVQWDNEPPKYMSGPYPRRWLVRVDE